MINATLTLLSLSKNNNYNYTNMKFKLIIILLTGIIFNSVAQIAPDKYYIQFTDKNDSPYSIDNPEEFLTQRAIDRRARYNIPISENDIPVNAAYIAGIGTFDVQILNHTKWLNGVTIYTTDAAVIYDIEALPYVSAVRKVNNQNNYKSNKFDNLIDKETSNNSGIKSSSALDYGLGYDQIQQLNGIKLHEKGYLGQGMVVAVLDAGFTGVIEHPVFKYLWDNNKILGTKDFVYVGGDVYEGHEHGKMVLSCMGANLPGEMIGTAPEADYWLLRSEEGPLENVIEEYNWVSAAEFADSVGADVINSSLSYFGFDMPEWSYDPEDMDGNTAISTIGADIAASKGMIVCNSAGNSGTLVGAPADGDSVFTVGSVRLDGDRSGFSSIGPTADGRIKPNIMSCGEGATIAVGNDFISTGGNGTSFSSPIMAGMVTCLWQSHPEMTAMEIQESIMESGTTADNPDNFYGWGIPDFAGADSILTSVNPPIGSNSIVTVGPNPFTNQLNIDINIDSAETIRVELSDISGNILVVRSYDISNSSKKITLVDGINPLSSGVYFLKVVTTKITNITKVVKR